MPAEDRSQTPLRQRIHAGPPLIGLFVRLATPEAIENLALAALDLIVIDTEHGTFDRATLSACIAAARAARLPTIVRVPGPGEPAIQQAIALGADGLLIPHLTAADARATIAFARGPAILRTYAGASRASAYRSATWPQYRDAMATSLLLLAQLDDPAAVQDAAAIARTPGLDMAFIGRIGLSLALNAQPSSPEVTQAIEQVCAACQAANLPLGMQLAEPDQAPHWTRRGVTLFLVDNDLSLLRHGADHRVAAFKTALTS